MKYDILLHTLYVLLIKIQPLAAARIKKPTKTFMLRHHLRNYLAYLPKKYR